MPHVCHSDSVFFLLRVLLNVHYCSSTSYNLHKNYTLTQTVSLHGIAPYDTPKDRKIACNPDMKPAPLIGREEWAINDGCLLLRVPTSTVRQNVDREDTAHRIPPDRDSNVSRTRGEKRRRRRREEKSPKKGKEKWAMEKR